MSDNNPRNLRSAAIAVLRATDAYRDAVNGEGHPGEAHDTALHFEPCAGIPGVEHIYSTCSDCAACGGAQYGTEEELQQAIGDLREAVGQRRRPWETRTHEQWVAAVGGDDYCAHPAATVQ